jgi:hypothetical protein
MRRVLHRITAFSVILALVVCWAAIGGGNASAQGVPGTVAPGQWASAINLQNVGNAATKPTISFFDQNGGNPILTYTTPNDVPKNGSLSLYVPSSISNLPANHQYSAVVSSVEPFQVSVNTASTSSTTPPWTAFAYEGIGSSQAGTTLYYPGLYKNYFSFNSEMVVQNAGDTPATLKADFYNSAGTKIATANLGTLNKNAALTFPIASLVATPALPSGNSTGLFGAVVTSTQGNIPLVGIANIWRTSPTNGTASYNAAAGGSSVLYAPSLLNNYFGFATALTIQNVSASDASVLIQYSNGHSVGPFTLKKFASQAFYQPSDPGLNNVSGNVNGVFSAKVTTQGGSIIGLVSQSVPSGSAGSFGSYNTPAVASPAVNISSVLHGYFGYFTAVTVQNTGNTTTDVLITYANGVSKKFPGIGPNKTVNILHLSGDGLTNGTATSAVVKSVKPNSNTDDTAPLVAVIQHNTAPGVNGNDPTHVPSDYLLAVTGAPK